MTSATDNRESELQAALNKAVGKWAKSQERVRELERMLLIDDGTVEDYTERSDLLAALRREKSRADEFHADWKKLREYCAWLEGENAKWQAYCEELEKKLESEINGDTSDGYHTFNELYHHRAVLFSVIVRDHRELAWKSRKHHDGTMYDGMFIVGIETPKGQATYHYDIDPYWEMFDCEELEYAPEWDGHTPDDAIARIAELESKM